MVCCLLQVLTAVKLEQRRKDNLLQRPWLVVQTRVSPVVQMMDFHFARVRVVVGLAQGFENPLSSCHELCYFFNYLTDCWEEYLNPNP